MAEREDDATHAIWHEPLTYDYLREGPPYLKTASGPIDWTAMLDVANLELEGVEPDSAEAVGLQERIDNLKMLAAMTPKENRWPNDDLGVVLAYLRALGFLYQSYHWRAKGTPFYGDHLLFERLYNELLKDIDSLAERIVGISNGGGDQTIDPIRQSYQIHEIVEHLDKPLDDEEAKPKTDNDAIRALNAEMAFLKIVDLVVEARDYTSRGTDNLLADLQDRHEANCYLLQQRAAPDYNR
jgi:starvation-inducible DNA-binding protein